jgi:hypothetical protein
VTTPEATVAEYAWDRQSVWSQTADSLKIRPARLRTLRLGLTVAAAILALAGSQVKSASTAASVALAIIAAVAMGAVAVIRSTASARQVRDWTRARSMSEALKAEVYLYLCAGGDYQSGDRDQRLRDKLGRLERDSGNLQRYTSGKTARERKLPPVTSIESYLSYRVRESQLEKYYKPKAATMRGRATQLKAIEVALALVAAGLAAAAIASSSVAAWAAVATTASGAVAAYFAAERYEFLWIEYSRTASELQRLLVLRTTPDGKPLSGPDLAAACEEVISIQNEAWMAKWGEEDDSTGDSPAS